MARWEPDARGRLLSSAIELFAELGYEATTATQIADRAGLTKTTLFRQFADKREILFQGQDLLVGLVTSAVARAPENSTPEQALRAGVLAPCAVHDRDGRDLGRLIDAIISASTDLQERALTKRAAIRSALQDALLARPGSERDRRAAGVLADVGVRAYYEGFSRWVAAAEDQALVDVVATELDAYLDVIGESGRHEDGLAEAAR